MADEIAGRVEFENRWCRRAALRGRWSRRRVDFARFERSGAVNDPDVILRVDRDANGLAENPVIGQRLRPHRIDFEAGRHGRCSLDMPARQVVADAQAGQERDEGRADRKMSFHAAHCIVVWTRSRYVLA